MSGPATALVVLLLVSGMLAMGAALSAADLRDRLRSPLPLLLALATNVVLVPALALLLVALLPVPDAAALALVLVAASPGGGTGALLSFHARGDVAHAVTMQALLAGVSLASVPLWMTAYAGTDASRGLDVRPVALALLVFQLLPLVAGIVLRAQAARLAERVHAVARRVADVSLAALVVLLLVQSGDELARQGVATLAAIVLLVAATLLVGSLPVGSGTVRRATAMTTAVRNLSMALLAARFADDPEQTALVVLVYGLAMYLAATAAVVWLRRARPELSPAAAGGP